MISYSGSQWQILSNNVEVANISSSAINVPTSGYGMQITGRTDTISITSTDTGNFTVGEEVQGDKSLGKGTIITSANDVLTIKPYLSSSNFSS